MRLRIGSLLPRRLRTFSPGLRGLYTLYGAILAAGVAVILTAVSYVSTRAIIVDDVAKHLNTTAGAVKAPIEQALALAYRDVSGLARQSLIANALLDSEGRDTYLRPFLQEHQAPMAMDYNLVLTDHLGEPLAARHEMRSFRGAALFDGLLERGQSRAVVVWRDDRAVLELAVPVLYGFTGTYEGALVFEADLSGWFEGRATHYDASGLTSVDFLMDGKLLARRGSSQSSGQLVREMRLDVPDWPLDAPIVVRVGLAEDLLTAPLHNLLFRHLLWGALAIALAAAAAGMIARVQTRRIETLTAEARRISRSGYYDADLTRERFGRDEVGDLAVSFARLLQELQSYQNGLEQTVALRTRDLAAREADLNRAQAVARIGSWALDRETEALRWSAETYRILDVAPATEVTCALFLSRVHPEDRHLVEAAWRAALAGEPSEFEHRVVHGDAVRWVREQVDVDKAADTGLISGAVGTIQDVTERRFAEGRLRQLSTAIEQSPASIVITDTTGSIQYVNPQFERTSGYSAAEAIGQTPRILKSGRMLPYEYASLWATIASGKIWRGELENVRKDGSHYWEIASISPIVMHDGTISGYVGVKEDITVQKQHERSIRIREAKLSALIDALPDMLVVVDASGRIVDLHLPDAHVHPQRAETYLQGHCSGFLPHGMVDRVTDLLARPTHSIDAEHVEFELPLRDGRHVFSASLSLLEDDLDAPPSLIILARDVTQRKRDETRMREALVVYNASSQGIMTTDATGVITSVNPAFCKITGFSEAEVVGCNASIFKSGRHDDEFFRQMWSAITTAGNWEGEIWNRRKTGEIYPQWLTISAVKDDSGLLIEYVSIFSDITQRKQHEDVIWRQANFDALTGLANRSLLYDRLERALAHGRRKHRKVGVVFVDLDGFKWINDTLGHDVGDQLLIDVAKRLRGCVREQDTVARLGGDEFTIVVQDITDADDLHNIGEKCVEVLREPYSLSGKMHHLSGSAGITVFPDDGENVQTLLRNADIAMYKSKQAGKNRFQFYARHMQDDAIARMQMESDLRAALASDAFVLHYQPIVDVAGGHVVGAEALIRWQHPERGAVSPEHFIPVAEDSGLIVSIGEWALREACRQMQVWRLAGLPPIRMAVNVSSVQFRESGLPDLVSALLAEYEIDRGRLLLEITESVLMDGSQAAETRMHAIKDLGIGYALDDFGTGFSSLSYLKRFPVDIVKIDRSFVRDCPDDRSDAHLVKAIIQMAHSLGLEVTAEGVESDAQLEFLRALGCDYVQGYLISRPVAAEDFTGLMRLARLAPHACDKTDRRAQGVLG